ncbi:DUF551 domain-containing protein [Klebsiella pneumoniae]|uniref:DUF551 domain-containing protein n=1 Tax=Klebsiella pneumoniae TaxID=573 RepID=UPI001D12D677|nr:DUF551 domain-containing protein [Klebsiella pneumoniae]
MINRDKLEHILEYAKQQRHIGQSCKVPPEDMVEIMERLLNAGNSPVIPDCSAVAALTGIPMIPDGYVMVPKEPTAEMISSGIAAHYDRSQIQIHDRPAPGPMECAYAAMLAAAPQLPSSEPSTVPGKWIPLSEKMPPSRHEVLVGCWWGEKPRWCCKWATYIPGHPDSQSSGWLIPGASWTPTHWMELPAGPKEVK